MQQVTLKVISYSLCYQVENFILGISTEILGSTPDQEIEEVALKEKPGEGETSQQSGLEIQQSREKDFVAPSYQLTGRVGLQASFVPPIIPLFKQVNAT